MGRASGRMCEFHLDGQAVWVPEDTQVQCLGEAGHVGVGEMGRIWQEVQVGAGSTPVVAEVPSSDEIPVHGWVAVKGSQWPS